MDELPLPQHGNLTTYNLENVLHANVSNSEYYKNILQDGIAHFGDLIDEIYNEVTNVEPWMSGNARGSSTAFCVLWKMFKMKPTPKQIRSLINHRDSPYIRALGFLYLRYAADPKTLWKWLERYIDDDEEFSPSGEGTKSIRMGLFVREILLDQYYFETIFPRIPESTWREIKANITRLGFDIKPVGGAGTGSNRRGGDDAGGRRPPSVKAALAVSMGQRAPHVSGGREEGRGNLNVDPLKASRSRPDDRDKGKDPAVKDRERDRERPRGDGGDRDRDRDRERERDREKDRERERQREKDRHREKERKRSRSHDRDRDEKDRHYREKERRRSRSRSRDRDRKKRSRSRSR